MHGAAAVVVEEPLVDRGGTPQPAVVMELGGAQVRAVVEDGEQQVLSQMEVPPVLGEVVLLPLGGGVLIDKLVDGMCNQYDISLTLTSKSSACKL